MTHTVESKICHHEPCSRNFYRGENEPTGVWVRHKYCSTPCRKRAGFARNGHAPGSHTPGWRERERQRAQPKKERDTVEVIGLARLDWQDEAICRGHDPETWFPIGTGAPAVLQAERAKTVCRACPVAWDCLNWALRTGQDHGVWGGATAEERREMKARLAS